MRSHLRTVNDVNEEITIMKPGEPIKRSSCQHQTPRSSNEKASSSRENRSVGMQQDLPVKSGKPMRQTGSDQHAATGGKTDDRNSVTPMHSGNRHKPWPSRKANEVEEVVKHMSRVPAYLQREEKGDSVQEKALNIGVLDWERLEKWMHLQKQDAKRRGRDSPSSSNVSSSSSQSSRSSGIPLVQRKQSPALDADRSSSAGGRQAKVMKENKSGRIAGSPDSQTSHVNSLVQRNQEKFKSKDTGKVLIYHSKSQSADIGHSVPCTSVYCDTSPCAHHKLNNRLGGSREDEKLQRCEEQSYGGNLHLTENLVQDQCLAFDGLLDHLEETVQKRRGSFESATVNSGIVSGVMQERHSGTFSPDDMQFSSPSFSMPYSFPLPSKSQINDPAFPSTSLSEIEVAVAISKGKHATQNKHKDRASDRFLLNNYVVPVQGETKIATQARRELSPHRLLAAGLSRLRSSSIREGSSVNRRSYSGPLHFTSYSDIPAVSSIHQSETEVQTANTRGKHENHDESSEPFAVNIADLSSCQDEAKPATGPSRRDLSPHRLLAAGLNRLRSGSVRESSSRQQTKQTTTSVCSNDDSVASNSKGRRSPLRRMLDPLLKSKNRMHFSGPTVSLSSHQANEQDASERTNTSSSQFSEPRCSVRDESCMTSTRRAVLKLAWKNGLPLFMFSSDNNDILAATIGKKNVSEKNDFECLYTVFTAHEVKKKGGAWMSQGNKSKKHGLVYNVVGHINVSFPKPCSYDSSTGTREFVLFASELIPTTEKPSTSHSSIELAAIVVQSSIERPQSSFSDVLRGSRHRSSEEESLGSGQSGENLARSSSNIVAVLPKGVHGLSSEGEPSPLIERWKSGGSCDCGGWDEGCTLTVLTDGRGSTPAGACNTDGTHQIELFTQGNEARVNKNAFSMVTFEEGTYIVNFKASVASMQAFAICVAILHCRKSTKVSGLRYSVEAQNQQEGISTFPDYTHMISVKTEEEDTAGYVPDPPPPSPVGRA
ncbi:uncharacterized protein M6B38_136105 [Iris pallida]|uniref:Uncharacterized protein n=1 Tax=Iris pallida TaxID=29817 RepID=A0AAX6FF81_IRIPA|nr:uncharacterized protein M6B38_136105 [Iris pallida]